jgi:hypothetical protein
MLKAGKEIELLQIALEEKMESQKIAGKSCESKPNKGNRKKLDQLKKAAARLATRLDKLKNLCKALHKFFKECKQYLLLGKCQSLDFDAQIADTTLSMVR